jgi:hypothetical protein
MPQDIREAQHRAEVRTFLSPEALARVWAATATQLKGLSLPNPLHLTPVVPAPPYTTNLAAGAVPVLLLVQVLFCSVLFSEMAVQNPCHFPASPVPASPGLHASCYPLVCLEHHAGH